jgi:AcrR family transcriptional regulator
VLPRCRVPRTLDDGNSHLPSRRAWAYPRFQRSSRNTLSERTETRRTRGVLGGRSERIVQQVLVATVAELAESGYRAFRMDAVSAAAGVNKTTIYRRWPSKALLVAAAVDWMRRFVHDIPLPDTGSLERDLVGAFRRKMSFKDRVEGRAWARLLAEKHDPEVSAVIDDAVQERSGEWYAMVTRAVARGELPDGTDPRLLLGMLGAVVEAWNSNASGRLKAGLLEAAVRTIVAGARSGSLVRTSERGKTVRPPPRTAPDAPMRARHRSSRLVPSIENDTGSHRRPRPKAPART